VKVDKINDDSFQPRPLAESFAPALNERIQKVLDPALRNELSALIVEVEEKGKRLLSGKNRKEFEEYKSSVKKFMQKALNGSFRLEEKHGKRRDGKFVVYLTMQKVDEALDNLALLMMAGQQDSMRLVAALDEVRGLMMDIYL